MKGLIALSTLICGQIFGVGCCPGGSCSSRSSRVRQARPAPRVSDAISALISAAPKNKSSRSRTNKEVIQEAYGKVAEQGGFVCQGGGCCGGGACLSEEVGYSRQEIEQFADANLGLGCGHPTSLTQIKDGDVVVDLGSGAGLDSFLAARKVGASGKVIGVDMTEAMIAKARTNAATYGYENVEFRLGEIDALPVESDTVNVVLSNCVINLAPDKQKVFAEANRVLKQGGKMAVSDVVLLGELTPEQKADPKLLCACVSGAVAKDEYLAMLDRAGFDVQIVDEDREIGMKWFGNDSLPIASLAYVAEKR